MPSGVLSPWERVRVCPAFGRSPSPLPSPRGRGCTEERIMQAVAFTQSGPPEVLRVLEVPDPSPGPGQVRIQVKVSGVNFRDIGVRRSGTNEGSRVPQPVVTGIEASGVVESLGAGVTHLRVGQRVATICQGGGYGGLLVVPAAQVVLLPDSISDQVGGTFAMSTFMP